MHKTKFYLFFTLTTLLSANLQAMSFKSTGSLLAKLTPQQNKILNAQTLKLKQRTQKYLETLQLQLQRQNKQSEQHRIIYGPLEQGTPTSNPDVTYPLITLCQYFNVKQLPAVSVERPLHTEKGIPEYAMAAIINDQKQWECFIFSPSIKNVPRTLQYYQMLAIIAGMWHKPPITEKSHVEGHTEIIKEIRCPVCLKIQTIYNQDPLLQNFFNSQEPNAIYLCDAHKAYDTRPLGRYLNRLQAIKEQSKQTYWRDYLSQTELELLQRLNDCDLGSIMKRIPQHMLPK